jgi:protein TonB
VDERGRSKSTEVNQSSGSEALDQAALQAIKRWRFSPARYGDKPVESWVKVPIDFRLTDHNN